MAGLRLQPRPLKPHPAFAGLQPAQAGFVWEGTASAVKAL